MSSSAGADRDMQTGWMEHERRDQGSITRVGYRWTVVCFLTHQNGPQPPPSRHPFQGLLNKASCVGYPANPETEVEL